MMYASGKLILCPGEPTSVIPTTMKSTGFIFAFAAAITWGVVYTLDQRILGRLTPVSLLFVNSLLSLLLTAPLLLLQAGEASRLLTTARGHFGLVAASLVFGMIANFFIYSAIQQLGASVASIFEITYPFFVVVFGMIFLRQELTLAFIIGALLILLGVVLIVRWGV
jgi:drug/metabolite transporter (DMT)-like permease